VGGLGDHPLEKYFQILEEEHGQKEGDP